MASQRAAASTCATISPAVRLRASPAWPVAQKTQPIAQPACVLMQTVLRSSYSISTVSMVRPSGSRNSHLIVWRSLDRC